MKIFSKIDRIVTAAEYIIEKQCTIRECAKALGVSKSTVHNDLQKDLIHINTKLHREVYAILRNNWNERTTRGGISTQRKYKGCKRINKKYIV